MAWWVASIHEIVDNLDTRELGHTTFEFRAATLHAVSPANIIHLTFSQSLDFALELFLRSPTSFSLIVETRIRLRKYRCIYTSTIVGAKRLLTRQPVAGATNRSIKARQGCLATRFSRSWIFASCLVFTRCANKFFLFFFPNSRFYKSDIQIRLFNRKNYNFQI